MMSVKSIITIDGSEVKNVSGGCKVFPSVLFGGRKDAIFAFEFL
jgi:hypothetical protein